MTQLPPLQPDLTEVSCPKFLKKLDVVALFFYFWFLAQWKFTRQLLALHVAVMAVAIPLALLGLLISSLSNAS